MKALAARVDALEARREIDVERINLVEADGTVRMVLSNTARAPDPVCSGDTFKRSGGISAGIIFYNDEGDECGGLVFRGQHSGDQHWAGGALLFDQFKQDQVVGLMHEDAGSSRRAGFWVWDRQDAPLPAAGGATRVFVGKTKDGSAVVELRDGKDKIRVRLAVDAEGAPRLEFLDSDGRMTAQLP